MLCYVVVYYHVIVYDVIVYDSPGTLALASLRQEVRNRHNILALKTQRKKSHNTHDYYNFYNDTCNFKHNEIKSISQQTDIINNITETSIAVACPEPQNRAFPGIGSLQRGGLVKGGLAIHALSLYHYC